MGGITAPPKQSIVTTIEKIEASNFIYKWTD